MKIYYVYILKCSDGSYYTGVTNNVERRFQEHRSGLHPQSYTGKRLPVELLFYRTFRYINDAIAFEKQVKRWGRRKKEALIKGDWEELRRLAAASSGSG